jgi:hypothetical protein
MAYAQWISIEIHANSADMNISVRDIRLSYGKFYGKDKDNEVREETIEKMRIPGGGIGTINSCGRDGSHSGTEGSFYLYDGDTEIGKFEWNCPWGGERNHLKCWRENTSYVMEMSGGNDYGAIGTVKIICKK